MSGSATVEPAHGGHGAESMRRRIDRQQSLGELRSLAGPVCDLTGSLGETPVGGAGHARLASTVNDRFVGRALALIQERLGPPPLPWCWVALGSAGREEEVSLARLEGAVVHADCDADGVPPGAAAWFTSLAQALGDFLVSCGHATFAATPAGPLAHWQRRLDAALGSGAPDEIRGVVSLLDLRPVCGDLGLGRELQSIVAALPLTHAALPAALAGLRERRHPLFARSIPRLPSRRGARGPRIDLGRRGLVPIADLARAWAYELGCPETSTLGRLGALGASRRELAPAAADLAAAYDFLLGLAIRGRCGQSPGSAELDLLDAGSLGPVDTQLSAWALGLAGKAPDLIPLPGPRGAAGRLWSVLTSVARAGRRPTPHHDRLPGTAGGQAERRPPRS